MSYKPEGMTDKQAEAINSLAERYHTSVNLNDFIYQPFDLPKGYVAGQVGPIYIGVCPEGQISS
jgi:hypothetical protein